MKNQFKRAAIIKLKGSELEDCVVADIVANYKFVKAVVTALPTHIPSPWLLADFMLMLDKKLQHGLLEGDVYYVKLKPDFPVVT